WTVGSETLVCVINKERRVEEIFLRKDLEDCPNDDDAKARLDARLKRMIKSACSPVPKIGFIT
ncbi:MAG: hypothetical protein KGK30_08950, partial [Elusimicrobia bacterium]|nr:hypothetical protein [Elusimicrobiota bacterium]